MYLTFGLCKKIDLKIGLKNYLERLHEFSLRNLIRDSSLKTKYNLQMTIWDNFYLNVKLVALSIWKITIALHWPWKITLESEGRSSINYLDQTLQCFFKKSPRKLGTWNVIQEYCYFYYMHFSKDQRNIWCWILISKINITFDLQANAIY